MGSLIFGLFIKKPSNHKDKDSNNVKEVIVATMSVGPSSAQTPSFCVKLQHGILLWPLYFGIPSLLRAIASGEKFTAIATTCNGHCTWDLMMVATDVNHQGKGYCSALLRHVLNAIKQKGDTVGLCTQSDLTRKLYERVGGFVVTGQQDLQFNPHSKPFQNWAMKLTFD
jgi:predicted GNAT family acetyltransferase